MEPKYPDITVQLSGEDGNAFFIVSRVMRAMSKAGVNTQEIENFQHEATYSDYDNLLQRVMRWVSVE